MFFHAEHPSTTQSNTEKVAGVVTDMVLNESENKVYAVMEVLDTPYGRIVDTLLRAGCGIGVSTRADGELEEALDEDGSGYQRVVPESYRFVTIDFTADPSTFGSELPIITLVSGETALYPMNFDGPSGGEGPFPSSPTGAGWKKLEKGNTVLVDIVTSYNGYYSDQTRTFFLGKKLSPSAQEAYDFCQKVLNKLEEHLKPGNTCSEIYAKIYKWADNQGLPEGFMGYGENRVKFFGHGVGLELDEFPILANKIDLKLKSGMVIAIEPKAYLKGIGALGLENTYVITDSGYKCLCQADQDIGFLS